jgi:pyrroline-5-carboxylate reductase
MLHHRSKQIGEIVQALPQVISQVQTLFKHCSNTFWLYSGLVRQSTTISGLAALFVVGVLSSLVQRNVFFLRVLSNVFC